jgi:DNA mismatch repair protein MutL
MAIHLLRPDVSAKIAAGEVIERPVSVVKELVENSLDAGATQVSVEVAGGGVEYIRVADNGSGIPADEVELAFQRFATSKVAHIHDLESISTLGFRGEALPSIATVAAVSLVSRSGDEEFGTRLDITEGEVIRHEPQGATPGTSMTVRHLFRNFPARRKFLRTPATETSRIQTLVTRYAMAYPEVRFQLNTERSASFASPGSGDLREALASVYGLKVAEAMLELSQPTGDGPADGPVIWGMIGPPSVDRANRSYVSLFVNRRWVQSRVLGYALEQAYHGFLKERRYPLAAVNVTVPPTELDVNVHPAKTEVRFRSESQVFGALQQAIRQTLTAFSPVPEIRRVHPTSTPRSGPAPARAGATFWPVEPFRAATSPLPEHGRELETRPMPLGPSVEPPTPRTALPALRVLGQVQSTYIAAEGPDGMYLIDQHAAHERVVFEKVMAATLTKRADVQSLLEPATVELDPGQQELVESHGELMARMGLHVEAFGARTYLLRGVPSVLAHGDPAQAFLDVLDTMAEGGGFESWEERAAYSIACHSAIRAGKTLSPQEMSELTRQLEECRQPNTCPHGRPTMIHLSAGHLEREFGRR